MAPVLVFTLPGYRSLLPAELDESSAPALGRCSFERFANQELWLRVDSAVEGRECAVLGSLAPPDEQLLWVLLLAHTLKREGAARIVALLPYLGYARQDAAEPGQSLGAAWVGSLLAAAGVDQVLTVDLHSDRARDLLPMPVESLSPAALFAGALAQRSLLDATVVAPDEGALERSTAVARAAGVAAPVAYLRKRRTPEGVTHSTLVGEIGSRVVVVDDILDTGGTLASACRELKRCGAAEIAVMVTHGLFTGERWRELRQLGVGRIWTTDTVPGALRHAGDGVEVLTVGPLVTGELAARRGR